MNTCCENGSHVAWAPQPLRNSARTRLLGVEAVLQREQLALRSATSLPLQWGLHQHQLRKDGTVVGLATPSVLNLLAAGDGIGGYGCCWGAAVCW